jgi:hypothetical protein
MTGLSLNGLNNCTKPAGDDTIEACGLRTRWPAALASWNWTLSASVRSGSTTQALKTKRQQPACTAEADQCVPFSFAIAHTTRQLRDDSVAVSHGLT